jgi:amidase
MRCLRARLGFLGAVIVLASLGTLRAQPAQKEFEVLEKSILELQAAMENDGLTSRRLVEIYLRRIAAYDKQGPALNTIAALNPEALRAADALDAERRRTGPRSPLHGVPVLVKDNYETIEMPTSVGSIALATFHPKSDAFMVQRLKQAGAVILGKTNMHDLAMGITNVGSRFDRTRNPYELDRNPGGSSGGTGAAIAANFAAAGMGSDTCGSIRNPASHNNLVGLRGTQGLSSRTGIVPLSSTQDIGGPLARSITDLALMLDATVGVDPADPGTRTNDPRRLTSYREALRRDALKGARLGIVRSLFGATPDDQEVTRIIDTWIAELKKAGAEPIDVVIPGLDELLRASSLIDAEFKFDFIDYLARHPEAPVKSLNEIIERGFFHQEQEESFLRRNKAEQRDSDSARRARIKRTATRQAVEATLSEHRVTALIYPTLRRRPARIGERQPGGNCQLSATSGLPALAVPAGFTTDGVPIGVDLLGAAFSEAQLLALGYSIEQTLKPRRPPFSTPPLVDGKAPPVKSWATMLPKDGDRGLTVDWSYEVTTGRLSYRVNDSGAVRDDVLAIWIHRGPATKPGAALHLIAGAAAPASGQLTLSQIDRDGLGAGTLNVRVYTRQSPGGLKPVTLAVP